MFTPIRAAVQRPLSRRWLLASAAIAFGASLAFPAKAQDTIKVGILHSLSGTMAISETTLKDVMLMLIEEQNKKGGLLGKKLGAARGRPATELAVFRRKAAGTVHQGKGGSGLRLLDLGVAQVVFAGIKGAQHHPFLSGAVRRGGERAQRLLPRRRSEQAGDPR